MDPPFDGETTFGWRSPNDSQWSIVKGMLAPQAEKPALFVTTSPFKDYELVFEYPAETRQQAVVLVGCDADGKPDAEADARKVELLDLGSGWTRAEVEVRGG